jgi:hypothetical protein
MPNTHRLLYGQQALWASQSPSTGAQASGNMVQINRLQSFSYDFTTPLEPVRQFGNLAVLSYEKLELPTVNFNANYLVTNVRNESGIGLYVRGDSGVLARILDGSAADKNYYVSVAPDGVDIVGYAGVDTNIVAVGNANLASYQTQGAVGGFPSASITLSALNLEWRNSRTGFDTPAINPTDGQPIAQLVSIPIATSGVAGQLAVIQPGDITVSLGGAGFTLSNQCIQSYDISVDLNLTPIICLGSKYPIARLPEFPIDTRVSIEVNMADMATGSLRTLLCSSPSYELSVILRSSTCDGSLGAVKAQYVVKGAVLESQSWNSDIGPTQTSTLNFTAPVGGANDNLRGLFISGSVI